MSASQGIATLLVGCALAASGSLSLPAQGSSIERTRYLMGTFLTAQVEAADTSRAGRALAAAFEEVARLELVMSSWRDDSELSRLNAAAGGTPPVAAGGETDGFTCSADLAAALDSALTYARLTNGAFDPTVEPLERAWDVRGKGRLPSAGERARALALVDWRAVSLEPATRRARLGRSGMGVDLGGIGKGLALDRAGEVLGEDGGRALLNFGGEILALGDSWEVTVADPARRLDPRVWLSVSNAAISTSGQSERGIVVRGRRYGHIFDPRSGEPVPGVGTVTVIAASATRADALSTALFVMGRDGAADFAARHPEIGVLWLEPAGRATRVWSWNIPSVDEAQAPSARGEITRTTTEVGPARTARWAVRRGGRAMEWMN